MPNPYGGIRAIKTKVGGHTLIGLKEDVHEYDSRLEARCARILLRAEKRFTPHVKYGCINRKGLPFNYTLDFLFRSPEKLGGISPIVHALEVKGWLSYKDLIRRSALKFKHGIEAHIVLQPLIELWEREGLSTPGLIDITGNRFPEDETLAAQCADLFRAAGIRFTQNAEFDCFDPNGGKFRHSVGFLFETPQKFGGISPVLNALVVKRHVSYADFARRRALKFKHRLESFIVTEPLVGLWKREGLFPPKENGNGPEVGATKEKNGKK